jgi:hypothetical protein
MPDIWHNSFICQVYTKPMLGIHMTYTWHLTSFICHIYTRHIPGYLRSCTWPNIFLSTRYNIMITRYCHRFIFNLTIILYHDDAWLMPDWSPALCHQHSKLRNSIKWMETKFNCSVLNSKMILHFLFKPSMFINCIVINNNANKLSSGAQP